MVVLRICASLYAQTPTPPQDSSADPKPASWVGSGHFEIEGFAQWKNLSSDAALSTAHFGSVTLAEDVGLGRLVAGPLARFIWTPSFKVLRATGKVWVDWGQIAHSRNISLSFGNLVNSSGRVELRTRQFEAGYAPRWGNSRFRVGPSIVYERLDVDFLLSDVVSFLPRPLQGEVHVAQSLALAGVDFDAVPAKRLDLYGLMGAVPCCGGGWHEFESELGTKYRFTKHLSLLGGVRYSFVKRDFGLPATTIAGLTVGPFSGYLKFPGVGPFVGGSWRF